VARGEPREGTHGSEAGDITSEENAEQTQDPQQAGERALGDATD